MDMESRVVSKKEAAQLQIIVAIKLFHDGEYECSITLAGAAEGQLPENESGQSLFGRLREKKPPEFACNRDWISQLNDVRDWLKHNADQSDREIHKFEAWIMLARALSRYHQHYGEETREMSEFLRWGKREGYYN